MVGYKVRQDINSFLSTPLEGMELALVVEGVIVNSHQRKELLVAGLSLRG